MLNITKKQLKAFTLLELLVVMTIIGVLMASSYAIFKNTGRSSKLDGAARTLKSKILLARTSAITKSRIFAVKITLTKNNKWKVVIIDSVDNILDNDDDKIAAKPYIIKNITFDGEQELKITPEGGISYATSNPIVLTDAADKRDVWKLPVILYKKTGMVKIGELEKIDTTKNDE